MTLEAQGRQIVEGLGGKWQRTGGMCRCPAHDDRSPSLSVRIGERRLLFHCFAGCDAREVLRALSNLALLERDGVPDRPTGSAPADSGRARRGAAPGSGRPHVRSQDRRPRLIFTGAA